MGSLVQKAFARQRPSWRRRLLDPDTVANVSTLRVLRAVEHAQQTGAGASVSDAAEYMAVNNRPPAELEVLSSPPAC